MDAVGWIKQHKRIRDALVWEDGAGARSFSKWTAPRQDDLATAVNAYLDGTPLAVPLIAANALVLGDDDVSETAFSPEDAWALYRGYAAHGIAMEVSQRFAWRLDNYGGADLARLLSSKEMFRFVDGVYRIERTREDAVAAPPDFVRTFLEGQGIIVADRAETIANLLQWCHVHLDHYFGGDTVSDFAAVWQYRGWPPVARVLGGTIDNHNPSYGTRHWTAGCWGTSGFLRSVLRAVNIPCVMTQIIGHQTPHFTSEGTYLSHGDDPYDQVGRSVPEITGRDLPIPKSDFDARFGKTPHEVDVGYRTWQLALGEVWRGTWTKGWSSFVPLEMNDQAHYLCYKTGNGQVAIDRVLPGAQGVETLWRDTWTKGWSSFVSFGLNGIPHYLAYKVKTGRVSIDRVRPDAQGVDTIWQDKWTKGWTSFVPFELEGVAHYLSYKVDTGEAAVDRIRPDGQGVDTLWRAQWTSGWTSFAIVPNTPFQLLLSINAKVPYSPLANPSTGWFSSLFSPGAGYVAVDEILQNSTDYPLWAGTDQAGWSSVMPFQTPWGDGDVLLYNVANGVVRVSAVTGTGLTTQFRDQWTSGWTTILPLRAYGRPWYLTYKRGEGLATFNHLMG